MPKPMSMTIEVEEAVFGKIFRTLDGMPGVVSINLKGAGPKGARPKGKANGESNTNGKSLNAILLEALVGKKEALTAAQLAVALQAQSKSGKSAQATLSRLKHRKLVKRIGNKGWKITPAGAKALTA